MNYEKISKAYDKLMIRDIDEHKKIVLIKLGVNCLEEFLKTTEVKEIKPLKDLFKNITKSVALVQSTENDCSIGDSNYNADKLEDLKSFDSNPLNHNENFDFFLKEVDLKELNIDKINNLKIFIINCFKDYLETIDEKLILKLKKNFKICIIEYAKKQAFINNKTNEEIVEFVKHKNLDLDPLKK